MIKYLEIDPKFPPPLENKVEKIMLKKRPNNSIFENDDMANQIS